MGKLWKIDKHLRHADRIVGTRLKLLDVPEPLSLRSEFTLAARSTMNVRVDAETTILCEAAILKVLEGITWPAISRQI